MPTTKRFCHHKINDQKIKLSIAQYAKGFSLIELLAVIVVMAILAGVALSAFDGVEDEAGHNSLKLKWLNLPRLYESLSKYTGIVLNPSHPAGLTDSSR